MEDKKTIFNYIGEIFSTFGIMILIFVVMLILVGDVATGYSTLFEYGSKGFSVNTIIQLFVLSLVIFTGRNVLLTDRFIRNMTIIVRYILFFTLIIVTITGFVIFFGWFPIDDISAWIGFFVSFTISSAVAVVINRARERAENDKMNSALEKFKTEGK